MWDRTLLAGLRWTLRITRLPWGVFQKGIERRVCRLNLKVPRLPAGVLRRIAQKLHPSKPREPGVCTLSKANRLESP